MTRQAIPFHADDLSALARSLRQQLQQHQAQATELPSHLSLLNMLARAAGHRNLQALRAQADPPVLAAPPTKPSPLLQPTPIATVAPARGPRHPGLSALADRALRQFDERGRLTRWPSKHQVQRLALWGLWLHFDSRRIYSEGEVNRLLQSLHDFGDHCTLRRELVTMGLLTREDGGRRYQRLNPQPSEELRPLLAELRQRHQRFAGRRTPPPDAGPGGAYHPQSIAG